VRHTQPADANGRPGRLRSSGGLLGLRATWSKRAIVLVCNDMSATMSQSEPTLFVDGPISVSTEYDCASCTTEVHQPIFAFTKPYPRMPVRCQDRCEGDS
jgi:DNA-directed RNA polymerase subunit RPC12/RpoP